MNDSELLRQYVAGASQDAFAELVRRHVDWVWSAARRQTPESGMADDVTQAVFMVLARRAGTLKTGAGLEKWLFQVVRFAAADAKRALARQRHHERKAAAMRMETDSPAREDPWDELAPMLDELVGKLSAADQRALLLRFYRGKSFAQVGDEMNCSEEAARKRVSRAIERLRDLFTSRGFVTSTPALGAAVLMHVTQPAPAAVLQSLTGAGVAASVSATTITKGTLHMMSILKLKIAALRTIVAVSVIGGATVGTSVLKLAAAQPTSRPAVPSQTTPLIAVSQLDVDDLIEVDIVGLVNADVRTTYYKRLNPQGLISIPMVGTLTLKGLTTADAVTAIRQACRDRQLIQNAIVTVRLIESGKEASMHSAPVAVGDYLRIGIVGLSDADRVDTLLPQVSAQGTVTIEPAGAIAVAGMSEIEAENAIAAAFRSQRLIQNAMVSILRITAEQAAELRQPSPLAAPPANLLPAGAAFQISDRLMIQIRGIVQSNETTKLEERIDARGRINLPFIGEVEAAGQTAEQLTQTIRDALKNKNLIADPRVEIWRVEAGGGDNPTIASGPLQPADHVRISIGDLIGRGMLDVFNYDVAQDGSVMLPMVGKTNLAGMTESEAEQAINRLYRDKRLIQNAIVEVLRIGDDEWRREIHRKWLQH
jgi:RNA polymerase sigma factor (sigma-70 family)